MHALNRAVWSTQEGGRGVSHEQVSGYMLTRDFLNSLGEERGRVGEIERRRRRKRRKQHTLIQMMEVEDEEGQKNRALNAASILQ